MEDVLLIVNKCSRTSARHERLLCPGQRFLIPLPYLLLERVELAVNVPTKSLKEAVLARRSAATSQEISIRPYHTILDVMCSACPHRCNNFSWFETNLRTFWFVRTHLCTDCPDLLFNSLQCRLSSQALIQSSPNSLPLNPNPALAMNKPPTWLTPHRGGTMRRFAAHATKCSVSSSGALTFVRV